MRASLARAIEAHKAQREENGQSGFSLIELIIVVVILGILAAIAIPIFLGLQDQARESALESIVGSAAAQTASDIAQGNEADIDENLENLAGQSTDQLGVVTLTQTGDATIDGFCITGAADSLDDFEAESGPGC